MLLNNPTVNTNNFMLNNNCDLKYVNSKYILNYDDYLCM